jgi:GntR family transcriptional regulator/MocR family aminotransferase
MVQSDTNLQGAALLVELDRTSGVAAHVQLEGALRDAIRSGRLLGDAVLPATRRLADELGLSRGVVVEAYQQLTSEGYLLAQTGGYTRVARGLATVPTSARSAAPDSPRRPDGRAVIDFTYGRPDVSQFPRAAWLRALRTVLTEAPNERLGYLDGRGAPELRAALAEYLNRVRGTWATPDNVVACSGFAQATSLLFPTLVERGIRRFAVEDPGDIDARAAARRAGLEVVGIPVTPGGIDVDALAESGAEAVLVTPAHQFPTGAVLSPDRRAALIAWARERDGLIVEDDYDAEHRYDHAPVGALHGLAPDHVVYAGTASKTLAPGLRLGWMIAPGELAEQLAARKIGLDRGSPSIEQLAFAEFLTRGEFDRHLRKMRPLYRRRRDLMLSELRENLPELDPIGIAAGLHVFCWLPPGIQEKKVSALAREEGLIVDGAAAYHVSGTGPDGLIIGYGKLDDDAIRDGVRILRSAIGKATL